MNNSNNFALIFAGGTGTRMNNATKPKQFLELYGKPIIIHTLEHFEQHNDIDKIVVVCVKGWHDYLQNLLIKFQIKKVVSVVDGGETGQNSIFNGLVAIKELSSSEDDIVLIHDGVRPLIDKQIITDNITCVKEHRTSITVKPVIETVIQVNELNEIQNVVDRDSCQTAVAPQSFYVDDIFQLHLKAQAENFSSATDSASLAQRYGIPLYTIMGKPENIKITTPSDYYIFKAIYDANKEAEIFG